MVVGYASIENAGWTVEESARGLLCSEKPNVLLGKPAGLESRRLALI